ncbi:MAG: extracellular solute-binding protein [Subdoligranulum sp.]|nr:extracellular solute-binding protein [Subdoligranulum sp.]
MKKHFQKIVSLLCLGALLVGMLAGCSSTSSSTPAPASTTAPASGTSGTGEPAGDGPLFAEPVTLSMMTPSHASWPFQSDWYVIDLVKEYTNVSFDITSVDTEGFSEKLNLQMLSGELPDLIYLLSPGLVTEYSSQGAFINIFDYMDQMPNFKAWYEQNQLYTLSYMSADGGLYWFPQQGVEETNRRGWLYRKDVFDELELDIPTNQEEFYNVLVKLKEAYPDSYPLGFRSFVGSLNQFNMIAPSWGTYHITNEDNRFFGYDYDTGEWIFGPTSDAYREMVAFYHQLYEEGLLLPNFLTIDTNGWQDVMSNSDSFITLDYLSRIDFFNNAVRETDPDFTMAYLPPASFGSEGQAMFPNSAKAAMGFVVSSQTKHLDEVLAFVDWMYTDEARDLLSWGRPGELYDEAADGTRTWKNFATAAEMKQSTGLQTYGFYELYNFDAELSTFSEDCRAATVEARKYDLIAQPVLAFTDEEKEVTETIGGQIQTHVSEEISKFLLGERSMDEWDAYVAEIEAMGLDQLRAVHESSYARVLAAQQG